jgi:Rieske Fe-S protein
MATPIPKETISCHPTAGRREQAGVAPGLSDRLAAGRIRRAARLREVPDADELASWSAILDCGQEWLRPASCRPARSASLDWRSRVGGSLVFDYPGVHDSCILVRLSDTEFVAFGQKCTHLSCAVIPKPEEGVFHCPCHEGLFDLRTGRQLAGPPPRPLPKVTLAVRDGEIFATGVAAGGA